MNNNVYHSNIYKFVKHEFEKRGAVSFGASRFSRIPLLPRGKELTSGGKTLFCGTFPYYAGEDYPANISLYARGTDYHHVVGQTLREICNSLREAFPDASFTPFCDSAAFDEVTAARLCGAAMTGTNRLAIVDKCGSYVFLGFILTDAPVDLPDLDAGSCINCMRCLSACPTGALTSQGVNISLCLSSLSQRKGELTEKECEYLRHSSLIWGCDECQRVCPYNSTPPLTRILAFHDKIPFLSLSELDGLSNRDFNLKYSYRAFTWRGVAPLLRNLRLKKNK